MDASHNDFWRTVPKWWCIVRIWFTGQDRKKAWTFALSSLLLSLLTTLLLVQISYAQRNFSTALSEKNVGDFYASVWHFVGIISVAAPLFALSEWVQMRLTLAWRLHMTDLIVRAFFSDAAYYRVIHMSGIDNPDQRITQDVASFVDSSTNLLSIIAKKVFNCVAFAGVLWEISPRLVVLLFTYAICGTWMTTSVFGRKLMALRFATLKQEADLRFALVRVRENAEAIAFYDGAAPEERCVLGRLGRAIATHRVTIAWSALLEVWRNAYSYATILAPSLITAPRYFAGEIQFGVVAQAGFAFGRIESALSLIVSSLESLSGLAAETERLYDLLFALRDAGVDVLPLRAAPPLRHDGDAPDRTHKKFDAGKGGATAAAAGGREPLIKVANAADEPARVLRTQSTAADEVLSVSGLTVATPGGVQPVAAGNSLASGCLVARQLSFRLVRGESVLIMGPSGCGKSSLLRVFAGLWTVGHGTVSCVPRKECCFLPQKPYMPLGTLRQQLLFPDAGDGLAAATSDKELLHLAEIACLPRVAASPADLDAEEPWAEILSLGEQQRVAFARLFRAAPALAFLDEASSALDGDTEASLYGRLASVCPAYVSVGHRTQLARFHTHVLRWVEPGEWMVVRAEDFLNAQR